MSAMAGSRKRRVLAEVVAFLLLVPMVGMIRLASDTWWWLLLGSVWVTALIVLQLALPRQHKPSYGLFALFILAGFVLSIALIELALKMQDIESGTASAELVKAVALAIFVASILVFAEELFFSRIVVFGWRQHPKFMLEIGLTVFLVAALYGLSSFAESWSLRSQVISLYGAAVVAIAILWFPKGRWPPRFAPLVMLLSTDLLLLSRYDVPVLLSPASWLSWWVMLELGMEAAGNEPWLLTRWRRRKELVLPSSSEDHVATGPANFSGTSRTRP